MQAGTEHGDFLWVLCGKVIGFADIFAEMVQFGSSAVQKLD
tara:strand:- start:30 stop:152 length:123 start_codon:yes stop_codon:yes gene_type:complete